MRRTLGLWPLVATIFFCVSGGPFGLEPVMKTGAGMGLLLILITPLLWAIPSALMTAELTSALPEEGGYYIWTKKAMNPFVGFLCAWWTWVYSWLDVAIYPTLFAAYVHTMLGLMGVHPIITNHPWVKWAVGLVVIIPFTWINVRGTKLVGKSSMLFVGILLIPFILMIGMGLHFLWTTPSQPFLATGKNAKEAFSSGLFVVLWNYLGWDSMSSVAGEVENPSKNYPKALAITVPLVTGLYVLTAWVGVRAYPDLSKWDEGAWTNVAAAIGGHGLAIAMTLAGVFGAAGLFSATLMAGSRIPFVLAEDGWLPKRIAQIHPRHGTPFVAILVSSLFYTIFSFSSFKDLAEADVVLYTSGLVLEFVALLLFRHKQPELHRPFRVPGGWLVAALISFFPTAVVIAALIHDFQEGGQTRILYSAGLIFTGFVAYPICNAYRRRSNAKHTT